MNRFAISDIHGCLNTFKTLLEKINLSKEDQLFLLGDYIDRGADSKGVIDYILELQSDGYRVDCLMGNHEELMIRGWEGDTYSLDVWLRNGGRETLASYAGKSLSKIPKDHWSFLKNLNRYIKIEGYYLVHAGLNFTIDNPLADKKSMLWIREWYEELDQQWLGDHIVVHGHTPMHKSKIERQLEQLEQFPVLNIDCGCVYEKTDMGYLCAFNLEERSLVFQKNVEK